MVKFNLEDCFNGVWHLDVVTGRGVVVYGRLLSDNGSDIDLRKDRDGISVGDYIILDDRNLKIKGIKMFSKAFDMSKAGDNVGLLVGNSITKDELNTYRKRTLMICSINELRDIKLKDIGI